MLKHVLCVTLIVTDIAENVVRRITPLTYIKALNRCIWIPNLQRQIMPTELGVIFFLSVVCVGGKVDKVPIQLDNQRELEHFLKVNIYSHFIHT